MYMLVTVTEDSFKLTVTFFLVRFTGPYGAIPSHIAAREGHVPLLRLFSQRDVSMNTLVTCSDDGREKSPLHVAAEQGHMDTVTVLLQQLKAHVNLQDSEGETALHSTVINEYDQFAMKTKGDYTETAKVGWFYYIKVCIQRKIVSN